MNDNFKLLANPSYFVATGFGVGIIPFAPGTLGTIVAIPLFLLLSELPVMYYWVVVFISFFIGTEVASRSEIILGKEDHKSVVIDEIVGFLIAAGCSDFNLHNVIIIFILFRFFDIFKPGPIGYLDKNIKGGIGVMLDDVAAGVAVLVIINFAYWAVLFF